MRESIHWIQCDKVFTDTWQVFDMCNCILIGCLMLQQHTVVCQVQCLSGAEFVRGRVCQGQSLSGADLLN